jgi:hypothetical protein
VVVAPVMATGTVCAICAAAGAPAQARAETWRDRVAYLDDVLVAFVDSDSASVIVAPRRHIGGLSLEPEFAGDLLGGLRNAALAVQLFYGASGATVEPTTTLPGAAGHVCYWVQPTLHSTVRPLGGQVERFVSILRTRLAGEAGRPSRLRGRTSLPSAAGSSEN